MKKIATNVQLTEEQREWIVGQATEAEISVAQAVRNVIKDAMAQRVNAEEAVETGRSNGMT